MPDDAQLPDTTPLIRLIATASVVTVAVIAAVMTTFEWSDGRGNRPATGARGALDALASDLAVVASPDAALLRPPLHPDWIWTDTPTDTNDAIVFTRRVDIPADADRVHLLVSCDNEATISIDGTEVGRTSDWSRPLPLDLTPHLAADATGFTIEVEARNHGGPAGLLATIEFHSGSPARDRIRSGPDWRVVSIAGEPVDVAAAIVAPFGADPWGEVPGFDRTPLERHLEVPDGFVVELVYDVPPWEGSWVSLAVDGQGRLITSDQSGGLYRVTPSSPGQPAATTVVEAIDIPVGAAQGLLVVEDDLYCVNAGSLADGPGLYRIRDSDGDDTWDVWERLVALNEGGEHGPHGLALGPEGRIHLVAGNYTALPEPYASRVPTHWAEDQLLPRMWDARGHAVGRVAPGGWIISMERDGSDVEVRTTGFRNAYDIAFDRSGELFAYDSDMEWDVGSPWYRPTRIVHAVSGADFGWRSGSGKWPTYYPDTLPAMVDIGPGSPTGLTFGFDTTFPERYRRALFALDWTFGTVHAVHLEQKGASFTATHEPFLTGRPLPVADAVGNPRDGALYVVAGGRGVRSAIYRIRAGDEIATRGAPARAAPRSNAVLARRELERWHRPESSSGDLEMIWTRLGHDDRFVAHAARVALEFRPVDEWIARLRGEVDPGVQLNAMVAFARTADPAMQAEAIDLLASMPVASFETDRQLAWLRATALCMIRLGPADPEQARRLRGLLEPQYPSGDDFVDREMCSMLVALGSPVVVGRTLTLMERADAAAAPPETWFDAELLNRNDTYGSVILKAAAAMPQQQQIALATSLRNATVGWTPEHRIRYFGWFDSAKRASGGLSFAGFLDRIRDDALETMSEGDRLALEASRAADAVPATPEGMPEMPFAEGPGRAWTVAELDDLAARGLTRRDFERGRRMFTAARCDQCHRVAGVGGDSGPDLSAVATRFTRRDLIEAILEPSRDVSNQYEHTEFVLDDDTVVAGRVVDLDERTLSVRPSPLVPAHLVTVERARIVSERPSPQSPMMPRLLDPLNEGEVLDLVAYLLSEGDARHPMFAGSR